MTTPRCIVSILDTLDHLNLGDYSTLTDEELLSIFNDNVCDIIEYYISLQRAWDWKRIRQECETNLTLNEDKDCLVGLCFLHSYLGTPSGKVYQCWSSNITEPEAWLDETWEQTLSVICKENGLFLSHNDEGDKCAGLAIDFDTYEEDPEEYNFLDNDAYLAYTEMKEEVSASHY